MDIVANKIDILSVRYFFSYLRPKLLTATTPLKIIVYIMLWNDWRKHEQLLEGCYKTYKSYVLYCKKVHDYLNHFMFTIVIHLIKCNIGGGVISTIAAMGFTLHINAFVTWISKSTSSEWTNANPKSRVE